MIFKKVRGQVLQKVPDVVTIQTVEIPLMYRYHRKARRLLLRLDYTDTHHIIKITVPPKCTVDDVSRLLHNAQGWLEKQIKQKDEDRESRVYFQNGASIPFLGKNVILHISNVETLSYIHLCNETLIIPDHLFQIKYIKEFLKAELLGYLEQKTKQYAHKINEEMPEVTVKELKSRYGSCSSTRRISYASKLVFAPQEVIDYVCVHEVAHLKEMNHSKDFWNIVNNLMPDFKDQVKWLKVYGYKLNDSWKIYGA